MTYRLVLLRSIWFCVCGLALDFLSVSAATRQPDMLYVTPANCTLIRGYGKYDLEGVAKEFKVKAAKVRYIKAEWGHAQDGSEQCNMVFATPKGNKSCKVFTIMHYDFTFGLAVPIPGNHAICND